LEALEDRNLLSSSPSSVIDLSGLAVNTSKFSSSDILVEFKSSAISAKGPAALAGTSVGMALGLVPGLYEINLSPGTTVSQALAAYRASASVISAEPDYALAASVYPNDPMFNQQNGLLNTGQGGGTPGDDLGVTHAWSVTTGSYSTTVAVMDTGVDYNQQDLYQNIWINQAEIPATRMKNLVDVDHDGLITFADLNNPANQGAFKITDVNKDGVIDAADILAPMVLNAQGQDTGAGGWAFPGNTRDGDTAHPNDFIGWNFVNNTNDPYDDNGHGTHVSGIIGAKGNNGVGIAGINWQVSLMPVKFLDGSGNGSISAFIDGLNYAVNHGAKISNNSWSGAGNVQILSDAINNARTHGMIFVAAAGNGGTNNDTTPAYPSGFNLDNIVSVAAVDANNNLASFSNYGPTTVELAAPGANILSTLPKNTYGSLSGTSMSTPMVTGVLALVWSEHPSWTYQQVINQVLSTVDPVPGLQGKVLTGGVVDAARAVGSGTVVPPPPNTPAPLQVLSSIASGSVVNTFDNILVNFSAPVDPATLNNTNVALFGPNGQRITIQTFQATGAGGGTQIQLLFPSQTAGGTYTLFLGAGLVDKSGGALATTYQNSFLLSPIFSYQSTTPVGIPDVSSIGAFLTVPQGFVINNVTVNLNMVNSIDGLMILSLVAPDGTSVLLSNLRGGTGTGFLNTTFDDRASVTVGNGQAPFTGSYQPEQPLGSFAGKNAQGTWELIVVDHATNYHVVLTNWSLTFNTAGSTKFSSSTRSIAPAAALSAQSVAAPLALVTPTAPDGGFALAATAFELGHLALAGNQPARDLAQVTPGQPAGAGRAAQASDALFSSLEGIDRMAELRVMMPHADRSASALDAAFAEDAAYETDDGEVVATSWTDQ
jgi:subtilisin family serine protease/subtilisin-like proprotein convertase family protein